MTTEAVMERAVGLVERYGEALTEISRVLADDTLSDAGKVMRVRVVLAGLDAR